MATRPVCIAGAGPVGTTLSMLLSRMKVPHILVDRRKTVAEHPQAHYISNRSMELFRYAGNVDRKALKLMSPHREWNHFIYTAAIGCPDALIGRRFHFDDYDLTPDESTYFDRYSPTRVGHLAQHRLEPILRDQALEYLPREHFYPGHTVTGYEQLEGGGTKVHLCEYDGERNTSEPFSLDCSLLVAADGAHSPLRRSLDINMEGEPVLQSLISVFFKSKRLGELALNQAVENQAAMLYFIANGESLSVLVAHHLKNGEFVAQIPFFFNLDLIDEETVRRTIQAFAKEPLPDLEIKQIKPWRMGATVAETYLDKTKSCVALCGDAAHVLPPSGGLGMNLGLQDVINLAWRIKQTYNGADCEHQMNKQLIRYERERHAAACFTRHVAKHNFKCTVETFKILGLDYDVAQSVSKIATSAKSMFPSEMVSSTFRGIMQIGKKRLDWWQSFTPYYWQSLLGAVRERLCDRSQNLNLISPGIDLGLAYNQSLNADYNSQTVVDSTSLQNENVLIPPQSPFRFTPNTSIGQRMFHLPIAVNLSQEQGIKKGVFSMTDLPFIFSPGDFVLLIINDNQQSSSDHEHIQTIMKKVAQRNANPGVSKVTVVEMKTDFMTDDEIHSASLVDSLDLQSDVFEASPFSRCVTHDMQNIHQVYTAPVVNHLLQNWLLNPTSAEQGWEYTKDKFQAYISHTQKDYHCQPAHFRMVLLRPDAHILHLYDQPSMQASVDEIVTHVNEQIALA